MSLPPVDGPPRAGASPPAVGRFGRAAMGVGNGLEAYDFLIFGFFAIPIGRIFYPASDPWTSLLLSVSSFGVGYLARPLGAVAIGTYADRRGRKPAMLATVTLMGAATFGIAVLPGFAVLGAAAPALLVALRLVQGFALGGEAGPVIVFLFEGAGRERRGRAVVWPVATNGAALLAAGIVGFALSAALPAPLFDAWGWRCALLLGLAVVPVGLVIRAGLPDAAPLPRPAGGPGGGSVAARALRIVAASLMIASGTVAFSIGGFMTPYGTAVLHLGPGIAFLAPIALGSATVATAPLGGWLADRVGRRRSVVASRLAVAALAWPCFAWMAASGSSIALLTFAFVLAAASTAGTPAALCLVADAMPPGARAAGVSVALALGISLFGSATQPAATALLAFTGDARSPAWLLVGAGIVGAAAALAFPPRRAEPAGRKPGPPRGGPAPARSGLTRLPRDRLTVRSSPPSRG